MLYEKLNDEFKDRLVTAKKTENFNDLVLSLHDIDSNIKRISKQSQFRAKPNALNVFIFKPPFKTFNSAFAKPSASVGIAVTAPALNTAAGTHPGPIDVSIAARQGPISQEKKDKRNDLGLCRYCGKLGHIAIDHKNPALLASKRQAAGTFINNSMALVPYNLSVVEGKKTSLS